MGLIVILFFCFWVGWLKSLLIVILFFCFWVGWLWWGG